jgi:Rieske Fe-S protein
MTGDMQVLVTRRTVLRGGSLTVVGGVLGWLWARNSAAAKRSAGVGAANDYEYSPHSDQASGSSGPGRRLVAADAVPAGGGVIVKSARVVVTKDGSGAVHGFSAVCTHQGCIVSSVRQGRIQCPCHGSQFDATTGKVLGGPAPAPLNPVDVVVVTGVVYAK